MSSDKKARREESTMEAIEAVLELAKERDELASDIETYESWFESLVGKSVTLTVKRKKHTRFVQCTVTEFMQGEGWELQSEDGEDEIFMVTFEDLTAGRVVVN